MARQHHLNRQRTQVQIFLKYKWLISFESGYKKMIFIELSEDNKVR